MVRASLCAIPEALVKQHQKTPHKCNLSLPTALLAITVQMLPASMTSLPMPSCLATAVTMPPPGSEDAARGESERFLLQAFRSFAEAADSLERSYGMLRSEVARLRGELKESNAGLQRSLEENRRMRQHLDRILDGLPCGVLVAKSDGAISLLNPEGRRLLGAGSAENVAGFESLSSVSGELRELLRRARAEAGEQEECFADGQGGKRWLAARHAAVTDAGNTHAENSDTENHATQNHDSHNNATHNNDAENRGGCVSIFILRDVSEAGRLAEERDKLRREQALAEMSAILAHEIRNPLGSLELFAGLLAGAGLSPECHGWVEQVQAGLRTLAATVNNVLHFHSLPAPERVPTDLGQLLDWAGGF